MAATNLGILTRAPASHRLAKITTKPTGDHRTWHTVHCACGWRAYGSLSQEGAESAHSAHAQEKADAVAADTRRMALVEEMEELIVQVWNCEAAWKEEDRIDLAVEIGARS